MRTEHDLLGERELDDGALYGIHTLRAVENFLLGYKTTSLKLIYAIATVKKGCGADLRFA